MLKPLSNLRPLFVTFVRLQSLTAATAATHVLASGWSFPLFSIVPDNWLYKFCNIKEMICKLFKLRNLNSSASYKVCSIYGIEVVLTVSRNLFLRRITGIVIVCYCVWLRIVLRSTGSGAVCECPQCLGSMVAALVGALPRNSIDLRICTLIHDTTVRVVVSVVLTCKVVFCKSFKCFTAWNCLPVHRLLCKQCLYSYYINITGVLQC